MGLTKLSDLRRRQFSVAPLPSVAAVAAEFVMPTASSLTAAGIPTTMIVVMVATSSCVPAGWVAAFAASDSDLT